MTTRRKLPPLNALRAFEAAARHVSFKQAAEELCVTSTAISHQIRHLETLIGFKLFERTPRSIALTEAGRRLFPVLRDGFDRFSRAVGELNEDGHSITVSVTPAFAAKLLIPALMRLHASHPDIRLSIQATEQLSDIHRGDVDIAVRYGPIASVGGVRVLPLFTDHYLPLASLEWSRGDIVPVSPEKLALQRLICFGWKNQRLGGPTWGSWMQAAGIHDFDDGGCLQFSEESHAIQAAIDGAGVVLASNALTLADVRSSRLVQVSQLTLPGLTFQCLSLEGNPKAVAIYAVEEWLRTLMPDRTSMVGVC